MANGDSTILFPEQNLVLEGANAIVGNTAHRVLAVGQMLTATAPPTPGTATPGELQENIGNDNSWDTLFGEQSMLAATIRAFKGSLSAPLNRVTRLDAIGIADPTSTPLFASGRVTFTLGAATAAGSITVIVGSSRYNSYTVPFAIDDTITDIGDALVTSITADSKAQVSAENSAGDVTVTAVHAGTIANKIGIKVIGAIPGVTIDVVGMSGGSPAPTLTTLFDPVATERYQTVLYPYEWLATPLTDFLDSRFNSGGQLLDGVGITATWDTHNNLIAAGNAENSPSLVLYGDKNVSESQYKGPAIMELPYETVGYAGGIRALRLTEGATISRFVVGNAGLDNFGGVRLSSKPYANTPFPYSPVIPAGKGFTQTEIAELKEAGITVRGNNIPKNAIISGEVVTTYKTDSAGNPDGTFKFLNYVDEGVAFREFQYNNVRARYAQSRLTAGTLIPGVPSVNEDEIRRFLTELFVTASDVDYVLTVAGSQAKSYFKEKLDVSIDFASGTATVFQEVPIITQFRKMNAVIQIRFDVPIGG